MSKLRTSIAMKLLDLAAWLHPEPVGAVFTTTIYGITTED